MPKPSLGSRSLNFWEPAKLATEGSRGMKTLSLSGFFYVSSVAHFVGWGRVGFGSPGSASPSFGATTLSASFAGWVSDLFQPPVGYD